MGISPKLLGEDETVVFTLRTHWKALIGPIAWLVLVCAAVGAGLAFLPDENWAPIARIAIGVVGLVLVLGLSVAPFLRWFFTTYTLTNRRLITRTGILNRSGHDIPLFRINDVSYERSLSDRLLGCGTLMFESAGTRGMVALHDIPNIEQVHLKINDMLFGDDGVHANARIPQAGGNRRLDEATYDETTYASDGYHDDGYQDGGDRYSGDPGDDSTREFDPNPGRKRRWGRRS